MQRDRRDFTKLEMAEYLCFDFSKGALIYWRKLPSLLGSRVRIGDIAGGAKTNGRWYIKLFGKDYQRTHLVWLYTKGVWPQIGMVIDHENQDTLDDTPTNLREVTHKQNNENARLRDKNKTGIHGVYRTQNKSGTVYGAKINNDQGKEIWLGTFNSFEKAKAVRLAAEAAFDYHPNHGKI